MTGQQYSNNQIEFYSVEYWQDNWDDLIERVENGEHIGIRNNDGEDAVMVPADDDILKLYTEHNEAF